MVQLAVEKRNTFGKKLKDERSKGRVPAILYGGETKPLPLFVDGKSFHKAWSEAGESTVVELVEGSSALGNVLINDVQRNPLEGDPIHIDFYRVDMTKRITATVPLEFVGEPVAVSDLGAILIKVVQEVDVEALPANLPHEIVVDVSGLKDFGDQVVAKDLPLGEGVVIELDADEVIALVKQPEEEKEEVVDVDPDAVEVSEDRGKDEEDKDGEGPKGDTQEDATEQQK